MNSLVEQQLGDYLLTQYLGDGGFAEVYLGEHIHLTNKKAAIKVLKGVFTKEDVKKFREEAQRVNDLTHPHIVQLITYDTKMINRQEIPFFVMDFAPGGSLDKRHPLGTKLPLETILSYVKPIAKALKFAHDRKVIHRDIKPANFLLGKNDEVLLSDFGIAVIAHATHSMPIQDVVGTPAYMAPEQFHGKPRFESDQYALAVVVYQWLCGELPFSGPPFGYSLCNIRMSPPLL